MGFFIGAGQGGAGSPGLYAHLRDEKADATAGGTFTSGAFRTRDLNTIVTDEIGITLSSNQFTLPAGTYLIKATAPAFRVNGNSLRLQNITDVETEVKGTNQSSEVGPPASDVVCEVLGQFTIDAPKVFELQHRCSGTRATVGFGSGFTPAPNVFAVVELLKVA